MSLEIFDNLPDIPKKLIVKYLLASSAGVELTAKSLPITWLFSAPEEEIEREEYFDTGPCLWIDIHHVEFNEFDLQNHTHYPTFLGLLLATHWNLVNTVYFKTVSFDGCGGLWEGPRSLIPQINRISVENFSEYLRLCTSSPCELDPFTFKEYRDTIHKIGCGWDEDRIHFRFAEQLNRQEFLNLLGKFSYHRWLIRNSRSTLRRLYRRLHNYEANPLTTQQVIDYFEEGSES